MSDERKLMGKKFLSYLIPAILAQTLFGVFTIVDGFFVGNSVGDDGLAAIGLVYPVVAVLSAAGTGIGMGGAVMQKIRASSGDQEGALISDRAAVDLLALTGLLCLLILVPSVTDGLLCTVGAKGTVYSYAKSYLRIIFAGSMIQIFGSGLPPLIRNHEGASYAMGIMAAGFVFNIVFDYLFVMKLGFGVPGAAWATVAGQAVTAVGGTLFFLRKRIRVFTAGLSLETAGEIVRNGASSFGISLCPSIGLFLMNRFAAAYGGMQAVTCYTVVSYVTWIVYLMLQGAAEGCQPLLSESFGSRNVSAMKYYEMMGYASSLGVAVIGTALLYSFRNTIGPDFGASTEVSTEIGRVLPLMLTGFLPLAVTRMTTVRMYAAAASMKAIVLTYAEFLFLLLFLLILPVWGGLTMVWMSMPLSQIFSCMLALIITRRLDAASISAPKAGSA